MSSTCWKMLPGPAGIAPASRRRPPAHSGRLRALGVVRQRRALYCAAELRYPVARGLAHARQKKLEQPIVYYGSSWCLDASLGTHSALPRLLSV